eukprot:14803569-Alexandrium_andersonii.AAC.1
MPCTASVPRQAGSSTAHKQQPKLARPHRQSGQQIKVLLRRGDARHEGRGRPWAASSRPAA